MPEVARPVRLLSAPSLLLLFSPPCFSSAPFPADELSFPSNRIVVNNCSCARYYHVFPGGCHLQFEIVARVRG